MEIEKERVALTTDTRSRKHPKHHSNNDTELTPVASLDNTPMADSLHHVGLIEFLDADINPVVIFDVADHSSPYENRAFQAWKQDRPKDCAAFAHLGFLDSLPDWRNSTSCGHVTVAGRSWRVNFMRKRWIVLTSQKGQTAGAVQGQVMPPTPPASVTQASSLSQIERASHISRHPASTSQSSSVGTDPSLEIGQHAQKPLDWTRYHVPGLTAHQLTIKNYPWETTSIGPMDTWPDTLRSVVISINTIEEPRILLWGPDHILIPNEACAPVLGAKFHQSIGNKGEDIWSEAWPALSGFIARTKAEAKATRISGMPLTMSRNGYDEETYWGINFVPIMGPKGRVAGVLDEFTEITQSVVQDRRRDVIIKTCEILAQVDTLEGLWDGFLQGIERATEDIPYAVIYTPTGSSLSSSKGVDAPVEPLHHFSLRGSVGFNGTAMPLPDFLNLNQDSCDENDLVQACREAWRTGELAILQSSNGTLPAELALVIENRAGGVAVDTAVVIPVPDLIGNNQLAFVLLAITPRRPFDDNANLLIRSLSDVLTRAATTIFLPDGQRRARQRFEELETSLSQRLRTANLYAEKAEARYEKILKFAQVGMYIIAPDQKFLYYNDAYLACIGVTKEQVESVDSQIIYVHEEDMEVAMAAWNQCLTEKITVTIEYRMRKKWKSIDAASGKEIEGDTWVLTSGAPELDEHGNVIQVIGWCLDISDRKYHERQYMKQMEAEQAEIRFARLAETAPMGMYLIRPNGSPIYLNDAYFQTLGFAKEDYEEGMKTGLGWEQQILPEDLPILTAAWEGLTKDGTPAEVIYRVKKPWQTYDPASGTHMSGPTWLQGTAFAEKDDDGNVIAVQGFVTDISLKKFSERLLTERLEEALETKRSADRFIDMVSHEMRNPLSAILQSADGILTALSSESQTRSYSLDQSTDLSAGVFDIVTDASRTIMLCAQHQKRIVDDILTLSKLDSNLLVISPDVTGVPTLLERCFKMYEGELERAEIETSLQVERGYRDLAVGNVMIDGSRVLQVIINLLSNAIKFTQHAPQRKITIFLDASTARPEKSNHSAVWVEARPNRPNHPSQSEWGTGEELYLQFAVQDTGKGLSEQELKLMFHRFSQASPKTYKQYGGSGLGLFISRELTELQGGQIGVHSAAGQGSIFAFYVKARWAPSDGGGGGGDAMAGGFPLTPFVGRTERAVSSERLRPQVSPPQPSLSRRPSATPQPGIPALVQAPTTTTTTPYSSLHVLVTEDNEINARVMANQLRRLGCTVHVAGNGVEALQFLETTNAWHGNAPCAAVTGEGEGDDGSTGGGGGVELSCILMDLEMPILGGLECVRRIRELQVRGRLTRHVPTIAVTANARSEQIAVAIQHGMDSVVTKPFVIKDLLPLMVELVGKLDGRRGRGVRGGGGR